MIGTFGYAVGVYFQLLVITATLGIISVLLSLVRPYNSQVAASVTRFSIAVLFTTAFSCLTFLPYRNITPAYGYTMAMGVFVLVINIAFVLSTLWRLLQLLQCGDRLRRLFGCCCARFAPCCHELLRQPKWRACLDAWHLPCLSRHPAPPATEAAGCCSFKLRLAGPPVESAKGTESTSQLHGQRQLRPPPAAAHDAC
jgi:hypothetical protein